MQYKEIVSKFGGYLYSASDGLVRWLANILPQVDKENWWQTCVIDVLSTNQLDIIRRKGLRSLVELDFSALLRIASKNWISITYFYDFQYVDKVCLNEMFQVRNNWAHSSSVPPSTHIVISDLEKTKSFFLTYAKDKKDIVSDISSTIQNIKKEGFSDINDIEQSNSEHQSEEIIPPSALEVGCQITVKANGKIGYTTSKRKIGSKIQFDVFIDGTTKTFFEEQIEPVVIPQDVREGNIDDVLGSLTAYQINKPSSDNLYSLNAARIDFVPYQFRPALKLIKNDTPRILIADSVGVGKTIEAGLILKELQARNPMDSVVVICPKPLVAERKWENEMRYKFEEDFEPVNGEQLRNIIKDADRDGEWPDKHKRLIIPYSLLTMDLLEGVNNGRKKSVGLLDLDEDNPPHFDMLIVDEAHHIKNTDTQAHKVVKYFTEHAETVVFLTATPIQLGNQDLYNLLSLLFPDIIYQRQVFEQMVEPNEFINNAIRYLRTSGSEDETIHELNKAASTSWGQAIIGPNPIYKKAIDRLRNGSLSREDRVRLIGEIETLHSFWSMINRTRRNDIQDFCIRVASTINNQFTKYQQDLYDSTTKFIATVLSTLHPSIPLKFMMGTILRQSSSCLFGLAPTLKDLLQRGFDRITDEYDIDDIDDLKSPEIDQMKPLAHHIIELSENLPNEDPKFDEFVKVVKDKQNYENNKIIVFSSFRHTLKYIEEKLKNELPTLRIAQVNGSTKDEDRYITKELFEKDKSDEQAIDLVLFTEVGSEGLDYQFCDTIINYDLPWNPMRIEQRIGRIDRRGQKSEKVFIYNCITSGTIDFEIYHRCLERIGIFSRSIGDLEDIIGRLTSDIESIAYNPNLSIDEKAYKLDKLADNSVKNAQELEKLEQEEKELFGVDISADIRSISQAENPWLSAESIKHLINRYLSVRLSINKTYIAGNQLVLTQDEKDIMIDDYRKLAISQENSWHKFLRSGNKSIPIVFSQEEAKNPKVLFVSALHPLAKQAANHFTDSNEVQIAFRTKDSAIPQGTYPFLLYAWEYTGSRPKTKIVAICQNEEVQKELPPIIQKSIKEDINLDGFVNDWDMLETLHIEQWESERTKFISEVKSQITFKVESLARSTKARVAIARSQIEKASHEKISVMLNSQIMRLQEDYSKRKQKIESTENSIDIHYSKIVKGILVVEGNDD
jgi:ATP-dependent helicase HepA